jgi:predicted dehydrogenase
MPAGERAGPVPLRWGVLGAAKIAVRRVIPSMQGSALNTVVAIASRDLARARAAAGELGIPRAYGSYEELLADPEVDAVYNPLPNHLHVPWSLRAAEAGKHVLCEKPIALSAREARTLLAVRDQAGVQIAEAFMVRTHPQWQRVRDLIAGGRIGKLGLIVGHFSYARHGNENIRARPEFGGGALLDIGCYPVTMSRWLFGAEPGAVFAAIERDRETGVDALVQAVLRFPAGRASFTCAGALVLHQSMHIYGDRARIEVEIPFNPPRDGPSRLVVDDGRDLAGGGREIIEIPPADQYTLQAEQFARAVRGVGSVPVTLEDAIGNMAVLDAVVRSAETGRWEVPAAG